MISIVLEGTIDEGGIAPYQAEFSDMDGYCYYARFRHMHFTLRKMYGVSFTFDVFNLSEEILEKTYRSGYVDFEELKRITSHIFVWPTEPGVLRICQKQIV